MMQYYEQVLERVLAIQWDATNAEQSRSLIRSCALQGPDGESYDIAGDGVYIREQDKDGLLTKINVTDWLVVSSQGVKVYCDTEFKAKFRKV